MASPRSASRRALPSHCKCHCLAIGPCSATDNGQPGSCGLGKEGDDVHVETFKFFLQWCLHFHPHEYVVKCFNLTENMSVLRCSTVCSAWCLNFSSTTVLCGSFLLVILIKMMVINMRVFRKAQWIQDTLFSSRLKGGSSLLIWLFYYCAYCVNINSFMSGYCVHHVAVHILTQFLN